MAKKSVYEAGEDGVEYRICVYPTHQKESWKVVIYGPVGDVQYSSTFESPKDDGAIKLAWEAFKKSRSWK